MDDRLRAIVARVFDIRLEDVTDQLERGKLEIWDSLNHLLLISEIENEMKVQFTTEEVLEINTFKDIREILSKKK
ncbi:MAG: acyl carrier protein [archaeon]|nr:acyl carrier protein [archaeon]